MEPGERIPREGHPLYEEHVGVVVCDNCDREIPITPKLYHNPPESL
jgi:uncharacterized Zn finger protein (UPF0148 family)